jgi:hypothetical protein
MGRIRTRRWLATACFAVALLAFVLVPQVSAYRLSLMNLADLATLSGRAFAGVCIAREEGEMVVGTQAQRLAYVQYTFRVTDVLKGSVGDTVTIRQVDLGRRPSATPGPNGSVPVPYNPVPLPEYEVGQEVVLLLTPESPLGLTSPVGMQQGVFDVQTARDKKFVSSRFSNATLFRSMSVEKLARTGAFSSAELGLVKKAQEAPSGPLPYESFASLVKKLAR